MRASELILGTEPRHSEEETARIVAVMRKEAFWQGALRGARKLIPAAVSKVQGSGLTRGLGKEMLTQTGAGAALGGLIEGGIGAATADEGQRGQAFLHGAAHGAATGALAGAATAPVTTAARNLRLKGLEHMAGPGGAEAAQQQLSRSWTGGMKDLVTGKGPMGRRGAAFETLAAPATLAAEFAVPSMVLGSGEPPSRQPEPHATVPPAPGQLQQMQPKVAEAADSPQAPIEPILGTALGGPLGAATVEGLLQAYYDPRHPDMRNMLLRKQLLPALGGAAGVLGGYYGIKALNERLHQKTPGVSDANPALNGALPLTPSVTSMPILSVSPPPTIAAVR